MEGEQVRELCCVKFIFSQSEHPNFELFYFGGGGESMPPDPPNSTHKNLIVVWKGQGKVKEFHPFPSSPFLVRYSFFFCPWQVFIIFVSLNTKRQLDPARKYISICLLSNL